MTNEEVLQALQAQFGAKIQAHSEEYGMLIVEIDPKSNVEILDFVRQNPDWQLNFLTTLCAIHYPENKGREFCMMYQLQSMTHRFRLRFKAYLPESDLKIQSVVSLFPAANWMERQEYDFFGVEFQGHPDLRRILNVDDMDYFPMRKQYHLEDATRTDKDDSFFGR